MNLGRKKQFSVGETGHDRFSAPRAATIGVHSARRESLLIKVVLWGEFFCPGDRCKCAVGRNICHVFFVVSIVRYHPCENPFVASARKNGSLAAQLLLRLEPISLDVQNDSIIVRSVISTEQQRSHWCLSLPKTNSHHLVFLEAEHGVVDEDKKRK